MGGPRVWVHVPYAPVRLGVLVGIHKGTAVVRVFDQRLRPEVLRVPQAYVRRAHGPLGTHRGESTDSRAWVGSEGKPLGLWATMKRVELAPGAWVAVALNGVTGKPEVLGPFATEKEAIEAMGDAWVGE